MNSARRRASAKRTNGRTKIETTSIAVSDSRGLRTYLIVSTPVVTGIAADGQSFTQSMLATITDARGVHVNRKSATEFESVRGEKYHSVA
jgi:hypothetical protein